MNNNKVNKYPTKKVIIKFCLLSIFSWFPFSFYVRVALFGDFGILAFIDGFKFSVILGLVVGLPTAILIGFFKIKIKILNDYFKVFLIAFLALFAESSLLFILESLSVFKLIKLFDFISYFLFWGFLGLFWGIWAMLITKFSLPKS